MRATPPNGEGGDVAAGGSDRLLVRHLANYLAATSIARRLPAPVDTMVDAGAGTGGLAVWAAGELGAGHLELVDHDPAVRRLAAAAWPDARVRASATELPTAEAGLVTAMEVLEHIVPDEQRPFVAELARLVAPGGAVVISTPDERGYPGGWSGYGPHVGVLDPAGLRELVAEATGWPVAVWRLVGGPFTLGRAQRWVEPVFNRARTRLDRAVPGVTAAAERLARPLRPGPPPRGPAPMTAIDPGGGRAAARGGTGLLAVALRPAAPARAVGS